MFINTFTKLASCAGKKISLKFLCFENLRLKQIRRNRSVKSENQNNNKHSSDEREFLYVSVLSQIINLINFISYFYMQVVMGKPRKNKLRFRNHQVHNKKSKSRRLVLERKRNLSSDINETKFQIPIFTVVFPFKC